MLLRYLSTRLHQSVLLINFPAPTSFFRQPLCGRKALNRPVFLKPPCCLTKGIARCSSSSSKRWQNRQEKDRFAINAKVQGLKSRAAYKLLEINERHKLFRDGQTVVDLGYAPGSWSQVALDRTSPNGRVVGIDIIPAQPPRGVSTIQGNFLSPAVQDEVKRFVKESHVTRPRPSGSLSPNGKDESSLEQDLDRDPTHYFEAESRARAARTADMPGKELQDERLVDVVLSDMSAPWAQTEGFWIKSISNPYYRMMNTSGMPFRDHAGSMDLCDAALRFVFDTLRVGGHFVCKFYQGGEDKALELRLKLLFAKVHREKPESSRSESKEAYFVALRRKADTEKKAVFGDGA